MGIEDEIFNQLVHLNVLEYEVADSTHPCRCCSQITNPTYRLKFEEEGDEDMYLEKPYLYICEDCYNEAKRGNNGK